MANVNKPWGLKPVGYLNASPWNGAGHVYCIPATDNTNAYAIGDPVVLDGGATAAGIPTIVIATAGTGNPVLGSIVSGAGALSYGSQYGVPADAPIVIPVAKAHDYYVLVADDPNTLFEVQEDSDAENTVAASIGLNINLIAGANNGYVSGWVLDSSSKASGATLQMKLLRALSPLGQYGRFLTMINNHIFRAGSTGI